MSVLVETLETTGWTSSESARPVEVQLRRARPSDTAAIHALIDAHAQTGHVLPRTREEIAAHIHRFLVAPLRQGYGGQARDRQGYGGQARDRQGSGGQAPIRQGHGDQVCDEVKGCVELAPLGETVAEVRSLVVSADVRGMGVGQALALAVIEAARAASFERLCAFTHAPGFFVRLGFSLVPHLDVPEKVALDCVRCPLFLHCGQRAVALALGADAVARSEMELAS